MLTRRTVVISPNKRFQRQVTGPLMAAGSQVDVLDSVEDFLSADREANLKEANLEEANLIVYHLTGEQDSAEKDTAEKDTAEKDAAEKDTAEKDKDLQTLLKHLSGDTQVVAVIPDSDLNRMVELLRQPRINNVVTAEQLDAATLSGIATRHLFGDVFGLDKYLPWGVRVFSMLVGDYQEKTVAIATVTEFAESMGVRRKYLQNIEKVIDELLMNALYDAPVDRDGRMLFADVGTRDRIEVQLEQKALLQYACDGERFAVAVKDNYGTLDKEVVLNYLHKCLHKDDQIDKKDSGAGLGLYIVVNSVSQYIINVDPNAATQAVCLFDLSAQRLTLGNFSLFTETIDALSRSKPPLRPDPTGERPTEAPPRPAASPTLKAALGAAVALLIITIILLVWSRL